MPGKLRNRDELIEAHKAECNHFVNGKCSSVACMQKNWEKDSDAYTFVGCVSYQTVMLLTPEFYPADPLNEDTMHNLDMRK